MDMQQLNSMVPGQSQEKVSRLTEQSQLAAPRYEAPYMISYTDQDILEELGPALTGLGSDNGLQP